MSLRNLATAPWVGPDTLTKTCQAKIHTRTQSFIRSGRSLASTQSAGEHPKQVSQSFHVDRRMAERGEGRWPEGTQAVHDLLDMVRAWEK